MNIQHDHNDYFTNPNLEIDNHDTTMNTMNMNENINLENQDQSNQGFVDRATNTFNYYIYDSVSGAYHTVDDFFGAKVKAVSDSYYNTLPNTGVSGFFVTALGGVGSLVTRTIAGIPHTAAKVVGGAADLCGDIKDGIVQAFSNESNKEVEVSIVDSRADFDSDTRLPVLPDMNTLSNIQSADKNNHETQQYSSLSNVEMPKFQNDLHNEQNAIAEEENNIENPTSSINEHTNVEALIVNENTDADEEQQEIQKKK